MSRQLIESIVSKNMLEASDMLEAKLDEIKEKKMYEMKRMFAAKMYESMGMKGFGGDPEELRAKGYKRAAPELERRAKEAKAASKEAKATYKQAKKEYKKATGKSKPDEDPYVGKGNAPWTMAARGFHNIKKKISAIADKEPAPVGAKRVKAAKAIGSGIAKGVSAVTKELGNISGF